MRRLLAIAMVVAIAACAGGDDDATPLTTTTTAATDAPVELVRRLEPTTPFAVAAQLEIAGDRVYVTDSRHGRIVVFSTTGQELDELTGTDGPFGFFLDGPIGGVDVDADGNLYVAESSRARIVKLAPDGTELATFAPATRFQRLLTVTVDRDRGQVYASDDFGDRFVVFDTDGNELGQVGTSGTDPGQLRDQGDLAVAADGTLWIADWGNARLQHLTSDGTVLAVIGVGSLQQPNDIAIDAGGRLWVADVLANQVVVFEPDGALVARFGGEGDPDLPADPAFLEFDDDGLLYVADNSANTVLVLRPTL